MDKKQAINLLKNSILDKINHIRLKNNRFKLEIEGNEMIPVKKEKGFNQTQIKQLIEIINATVPPIVVRIINETVPPMIDKALEPIKRCPTIARELAELENNK